MSIPDPNSAIAIIIPAYNPDECLLDLVKELMVSGLKDIVVVNDGSDPDHAAIFEALAGLENVCICEAAPQPGAERPSFFQIKACNCSA